MNYEKFENFYREKGYLPNDVGPRKNKLNEKQIKTRYKKYLQQEERKVKKFKEKRKKERESRYTIHVDEKWENFKSQLDLSKCSLLERFEGDPEYEVVLEVMKRRGGHLLKTIDPAHVFSRAEAPHMKYEVDNVVPLNRFSHSMLDTMRSPITGEPIDKKEHDEYWEFIVGEEKYKELKERSRKRRRNG